MKKYSITRSFKYGLCLTMLLITGVSQKSHAWRFFGSEAGPGSSGSCNGMVYSVHPVTTYFFGIPVSTEWVAYDAYGTPVEGDPCGLIKAAQQ